MGGLLHHVPKKGTCLLGAVGDLPVAVDMETFLAKVKEAFGCAMLRVSRFSPSQPVSRVALCGGAAGEFVPEAVAAGVMRLSGVYSFVPCGARTANFSVVEHAVEDISKARISIWFIIFIMRKDRWFIDSLLGNRVRSCRKYYHV